MKYEVTYRTYALSANNTETDKRVHSEKRRWTETFDTLERVAHECALRSATLEVEFTGVVDGERTRDPTKEEKAEYKERLDKIKFERSIRST